MKTNVGLLVFLLAIGTGCVTQDEHWNRRVGHFTYQQAIGELGSPATQETLADGRVSVEWISRYNINASSPEMDSGFYSHSASFTHIEDVAHESRLRLTFSTNNILTSWSKD